MASRAILSVAVFVACIAVTLAVVPQSKLYFSIPIPATPAATPVAATPTTNTTTSNTTTTTTTTGTQLNIIPLGQVLGNLLTGFFGGASALVANAVNVIPFGQLFGILLTGFFGSGWTASG